jgi:hypothetical protein
LPEWHIASEADLALLMFFFSWTGFIIFP